MIASMMMTATSVVAMMTNGKVVGMKKIDIQAPADQLLRIVEEELGLYAYRDTLDLTKIGTQDYQDNYSTYYGIGVARKDEKWKAEYFGYMQKQVGNSRITFAEIMEHISSISHKKEASFASKMLATLNPDFPILDSNVANYLGFKYRSKSTEDCIEIYNELTKNVHAFLQTDDGARCVEEFNRMFPNFTDINPVKKIDLYLWKMGK